MPNTFQMERSERSGVVVLALDGYLDAHTAPAFEKSIETEHETGHRYLVVDCSRLTYISSAGLGVFMSFIEEIREAGGDIKLAAISPKVYQVFEVLGFPSLFEIFGDTAAAINKFNDTAAKGA
jgi:anti-sigma B factor antagonist